MFSKKEGSLSRRTINAASSSVNSRRIKRSVSKIVFMFECARPCYDTSAAPDAARSFSARQTPRLPPALHRPAGLDVRQHDDLRRDPLSGVRAHPLLDDRRLA